MIRIPLNRMKRTGKVDIWDLGPQTAPVPPAAPVEPDPKLKGHELAAAQVEYEDSMAGYKDRLRAYTAARKAFADWKVVNGGPIKVEFWGIDAMHAMETDPERYKLDLPNGMKPGRAQYEAEERAKAEREELERLAAIDPQYGSKSQSSGVAA